MANIKEVQRTEYLKIRMSKQEKEFFEEYARKRGMKPSRLARNILMIEAEKKLAPLEIPIAKAYYKYLEITNQKEWLDEIRNTE